MIYLLNYAHLRYLNSQKLNSKTALEYGKFDKIFECSFNDIDKEFYENNKKILEQPRGAGYWLWKPYLLLKKLKEINDNDFIFYCDSGSYFISSIKPLMEICKNKTKGILGFHLNEGYGNYDCKQTKRDTYFLMGCDNKDYWYENYPRNAGFILFQKNEFSINFINEWLYYSQIERIITDIPNQCGLPNLPEFIDHRHDQSIYSILIKKHNIKTYTDPTQWGNPYRTNNKIPHIIQHTRS